MDEVWKPYPGMQTRFLQSTAFETLAGGSRGPGKTAVGVVNGLKPQYLSNPRVRGLVIRKNADDLADWMDRARYYYKRYGGDVTGKPGLITFPSGYKIRTGHLKDENAYTKYQGQEYQWMLIEELTQIKREIDYLKLIASCRSSIPGIEPRVYGTTNPGGFGHGWVKARFVDPSPPNTIFIGSDTGRTRVFFPGTVDDNPALMENDPDYVKMLDGLKATDLELWKAWRLGDWNTFAGQFFKEFRKDLHVCRPFLPDKANVLVGGLDWGYNAPFSFHVSEVSRIEVNGKRFHRVKTFLEIYGVGKTPAEWAGEIKDRLKFFGLTLDDLAWIQADPAIFNKGTDGSIAIRDQFIKANDQFYKLKRGSNDRIPGWAVMHQWLSIAADGLPYWQLSSNCINGIKEMGAAVYDENKIEDLDAEFDHFLDSARYMLKALKWIDAGAMGAAFHPQPNQKYMQRAPQFIGDKQVGINVDLFAQPKGGATDNQVGGIIRA